MTGSNTGAMTVDFDKARAAVETLKGNPPCYDDVANDPKAFLASMGVEIDENMLSTLKAKMAASPGLASAPKQGAVIHIDV